MTPTHTLAWSGDLMIAAVPYGDDIAAEIERTVPDDLDEDWTAVDVVCSATPLPEGPGTGLSLHYAGSAVGSLPDNAEFAYVIDPRM